jgi:hypothetical protein
MAGTTGTTGTGGKATSAAGTTGSSSGGGLASASSTGAAPSTTAIGAVIIPGPNAGLITLTIDSENLGSNPTPGGVVNASGTWNTGSTFGGSYNTASDVLSVSSNAFSAGFMGMLAGEAINGDWVGDSYDLPFSLITVANGATVRAFCGSNGAETESLGVVFSTDGTLAGVQDGTAGVGKIGGSYSDGLATVTGIGSFIFTTDSDGGESFVGTGWTMAPCQ